MSELVVPGDRLGPASSFACGEGTYARSGFIYASICGRVQQSEAGQEQPSTSSSTAQVLHADVVNAAMHQWAHAPA